MAPVVLLHPGDGVLPGGGAVEVGVGQGVAVAEEVAVGIQEARIDDAAAAVQLPGRRVALQQFPAGARGHDPALVHRQGVHHPERRVHGVGLHMLQDEIDGLGLHGCLSQDGPGPGSWPVAGDT